jgi:ubiquinone/menaquinone biosynthesis C-methylase UbiE
MENQDQKTRVQASFAASARAYVKSPGHAAGEDLDYLVRWASAHGGALVLDVATGGGHTALAMAGVCEQVIALDFTIPAGCRIAPHHFSDVERRRDPTHVRAYRRDEWRSYLEAAGLRIAGA